MVVTAYCCHSAANWQLNGRDLQKIITLGRAFANALPA